MTMGSRLRRLRSSLARDDGMALMLVVSIAAVLFLLATLILGVVLNHQLQSIRYSNRTKAMHMADAGLNAYLYELKRDPTYYNSNPTLGPTTLADGTWSVTTTPPQDDEPLYIRSVGTMASTGDTRTIVATVRFPTYADYMFLANDYISIGTAATIYGKVRSNNYVTNAGRVTGRVEAVNYVNGTGIFEQGKYAPVPVVDFAQVTTDLSAIRTAAGFDGTYYSPSGRKGYMVTLQGDRARIDYVTGGDTTGLLTTYYVGTVNIPASGVFYFDDIVWVSGTYSAKVTIASSQIIRIHDNITPVDVNSTATCGLIAKFDVNVMSWYPNIPTNTVVYAAMLSQQGSVCAEMKSGYIKNSARLVGSNAYFDAGGFVTVSGTTVLAGYRSREYIYDPRLDVHPPPMYPQIKDGSLKVSSWVEQ